MADEIKQTITIEANLTKIGQDLQKLQGDFRSSFAQIQSAAGQLGAALGISLSAAAIVNFVKASVSEIGKLQDAFEQTGVSADLLLKLKPILENSGSSVDEFARSINSMQKLLVDGSADTIAAFKKVGIEANEILRLAENPEELIDRVAKGLANLATQTERVAVARELASRAGGRIAPALLELANGGGIAALRAQKGGISKEDIADLDAIGDKFNTVKLKAEEFAAITFLNVTRGLGEVFDIVSKLTVLLPKLPEGIGEFSKEVAKFATGSPLAALLQLARGATSGKPANQQDLLNREKVDSEIAGAASSAGPGLKETNAQRDFNKALDEQIKSLHSQVLGLTESKEAAIANAAAILQDKAALIGLDKSSADLQERLAKFREESLKLAQGQLAESLNKQNQSIEVQIASMTQGKAAAEQLALKYTLLDAKLSDIGPAAEAAAKRQRELNDEQARAVVPQTLKELSDAKDTAQTKKVVLGVTFNADEPVRQAIENAIDKLANEKDPRARALAFEAVLNLKPQLDQARIDSIVSDLKIGNGLDVEFSKVLNQTFANTFDIAASKVQRLEDSLQRAKQNGLDPMGEAIQKMARDLDQAKLDQSTADLARDLRIASNEALLLGRSFDLGAANVSAIETQLRKLISEGLDPANEKVKQLVAQLQGAKVDAVFGDLKKGLEDVQKEAQVLGGAIDLPAETVGRLTEAIKRLIAEGLDPLDPRIQDLKRQLEDAQAAQHFAEAFQNIGQAIGDAFVQLQNGGKWKDVLKNLGAQVNRAITDALITKPLQDFLKKAANDVFGGIFGTGSTGSSVTGPDTAASQQFSLSTTQFAAAVAQFAALSGIQTGGVPAGQTSGGIGGLLGVFGGLLGGSSLPQGFGARPAGVAGPLLPNGGFYSKDAAVKDAAGKVGDMATTSISEIQRFAESSLGSFRDNATSVLDLIQRLFSGIGGVGGSVSGIGGGGIFSFLGGMFGGGDSTPISAAEAVDLFNASGQSATLLSRVPAFHQGGEITADGRFASFAALPRLHSGGDVPIMAQTGEYMMNRMATSRIGRTSLAYMNRTGTIPRESMPAARANADTSGSAPIIINITNPNFADRRSQAQILAKMGSQVKNANRNM